MMAYDLLGAKLILEKNKNSKSENNLKKNNKSSFWKIIFPFFNYKLDLAGNTDWDIDS